MISVLIIEDDLRGAKLLKSLLEDHFEEIKVLAIAGTVEKGIAALSKQQPDLLFLDIHLPDGSGFQILNHYEEERSFEVIFTTAYTQYALQAFKAAALHYLVKPIGFKDLQQAVERYKDKQQGTRQSSAQLQLGQQLLEKKKVTKLPISNKENILVVDIEQIIYLEAEGTYTKIYLANGEYYLSSKNIGHYEKQFLPDFFFRIHQKYCINLNYIQKYIKGKGGTVIMSNGASLIVSTRRKSLLIKLLGDQKSST
ncbi:MAG: LytTR family DNA-binding domain-containing protein [Saprospiraceae bacterium]|nr:LytTR family DNA-binding domain-containing protein [Saprospiraceae bacterium]